MVSPYATIFTVTTAAHNALKEEIAGLNYLRARFSAKNKQLREALASVRGFVNAAPDDTWGYDTQGNEEQQQHWPIKSELLHNIDKALSESCTPESEAK